MIPLPELYLVYSMSSPISCAFLGTVNISLPLYYPPKILEGGSQRCPPEEQLEVARAEIRTAVQCLIGLVQIGQDSENPAVSCRDIQQCNPNSQSGNYWVRTSDGTAIETFCDMQ